MKSLRNVVTLSNINVELEQWAREEAQRTSKPFYQVFNEALEVLRLARQGQKADEGGGAVPSIRGPTPADPAGDPIPN
jgi:hypothetical protein